MKKKKRLERLFSVISGAVCGIVNGIFGGGGGMVLIPMMTKFLGKESKKAHATALVIILPISIVSGIMYSVFLDVKINQVLVPSLGVVAGGVLGAFLLDKIKGKAVEIIFAVLMMVSGVKMAGF